MRYKFTFLFVIFFLNSLTQNITAQVSWSVEGPGGGGWLTSMTIVNDETNSVYVGCDVGGIYKSIDNGLTWEIKDKGLSMYFTHDIAYDPATPDTLYLATRGGVYRSFDAGENWEAKRSGFPDISDFTYSAPVSDIAIDYINKGTLYAGIGVPNTGYDLQSYHWQSAETKGSIYKSTDYGDNWIQIYNTGIDTSAMIFSLAIDPVNSNLIYAATSAGVYMSTNAGDTWSSINTGLPHLLTMKILIDPIQPNTLYLTIWAEPGSGPWKGGVYKSVNGGGRWDEINAGLPQIMGDVSGLTCNYPSILIDKSDHETLYVGNIPWTPNPGVYKTINGGDSWDWISNPDENMEIGWNEEAEVSASCMAINPMDSNNLYFGTSMHLFKTTDAGTFWNQTYTNQIGDYWQGNGFETTVVQSIAVDPKNSNNVYVGYWDLGFFKSIDGGKSFKNTSDDMHYYANTFDIIVDPTDSEIIYATGGWWEENLGEVYKSIDSGETWTAINTGMLDAQVWSIALDKNSPVSSRILYAASYGNGIYKSINGGASWVLINNGLGVESNGVRNLQMRKIYIDPNNSDILYAGIEAMHIDEEEDEMSTIQGGLFKSSDQGVSWSRIDAGNPMLSVWDIEVAQADSDVVYTAVSSEFDHSLEITYNGGIYKSINAGNSWEMKNSGLGDLDNLNAASIAISPVDNSILYMTTTDAHYHDLCSGRGIFKSTDAASSWTAINDGLGVLYYDSFSIDTKNPNVLYAGSGGNGLLKGIDDDIASVNEINQSADSPISTISFPNPFNEEINIQISLEDNEIIDLYIYNMQGQMIRSIIKNKYYKAGIHTLNWNGFDTNQNQVSSGVYIYRIHTKENSVSGKLIKN